MARYPHVVQAPPERVYDTLVSPAARTRHQKLYKVADAEKGKAGEKGQSARYETKLLGAWRETLVETERPHRAVFEERAAAGDDAKATVRLEWRLAPVRLGTHVVLEAKGTNLWNGFVARLVKRYRYRAVVRALKQSVEGEPESIVPDFPTIEEWKARQAAQDGASDEGTGKGKAAKATDADDAAEAAAEPAPPKRLKALGKGTRTEAAKAAPAPAAKAGKARAKKK